MTAGSHARKITGSALVAALFTLLVPAGPAQAQSPAQSPACPLRLHLQTVPRQRTATKSPPPPHAATSGTLWRSAGREQASVSASAGQAGDRASAAPAQPPAPCFPLPAWCPWAGVASRG